MSASSGLANMSEFRTVTNSPEETIELGRLLGKQLRGGEIIAVTGPLGSGKTHFIKGLAAGAGGGNMAEVNSPTFVIVNEYQGRFQIFHLDAFRLANETEFELLGFDELCHPGSVVVIEWADKVAGVLSEVETIDVFLAHIGPTQREVVIKNIPLYVSFEQA